MISAKDKLFDLGEKSADFITVYEPMTALTASKLDLVIIASVPSNFQNPGSPSRYLSSSLT